MATETDAAFERSAVGEAVICIVAGDGGSKGAVYTPLEETVPQAPPAQPEPDTDHEITRLGFEFAVGISVAV
jgi:hypothetical protein